MHKMLLVYLFIIIYFLFKFAACSKFQKAKKIYKIRLTAILSTNYKITTHKYDVLLTMQLAFRYKKCT